MAICDPCKRQHHDECDDRTRDRLYPSCPCHHRVKVKREEARLAESNEE